MSTEEAQEAAQAAPAAPAAQAPERVPVPTDLQDMEQRIMEGVRLLLQNAGLSSLTTPS